MDSVLQFPCEFSLKIIGASYTNLEFIVLPILTQNKVDIERMRITSNQSRAGKYTALTVTIWATSQEQLDEIYRSLSSHPEIIMAL